MLDEEALRSALLQKKLRIVDDYGNLRVYRKRLRETYIDQFPRLTGPRAESLLGGAAGAIPVEAFQEAVPLRGPFTDAARMKEWAADALTGRVVVGVDGSQVYTSSDFNMPVALVQAGAFWIQYSQEGSSYGSDRLFRVYVGAEALEGRGGDEPLHQMSVDERRMALEMELASRVIGGWAGKEAAVYLMLDTPLLLRYIGWAGPEVKRAMCGTMTRLLDVCEGHRVPLVGYTDYSLARDLTSTLESFLVQEESASRVSDAAVVGPLLEDFGFGARTPMFQVRHPLLEEFYGRHRGEIGFFYQKLHSDLPVRVEFPLWVHRAGRVDELAEAVAAQAVLGEGYPYVLLRAHETAVLDSGDRGRFYDVVARFLSHECGVPFRETAKAKRKRLSIV